ncbi:hypothetical protein PILCRDRAFT_826805, partial [Piloderma croceum F 1598]
MDQVVERFNRVRKDLTSSKLRAWIADRDEKALKALYRGLTHLGQRVQYAVCGFPAVPLFELVLLFIINTTALRWKHY